MPIPEIVAVTKFLVELQSDLAGYGYVGLFLANFIGSATIILPVPSFAMTFLFGSLFNPILVGVVAGLGAAFGEFTSYAIGRGGEKLFEKKYSKLFAWGEKWFKKRKEIFPIIVLFAATPLPDDVIGILCGIFNYNFKKFLMAVIIGKVAMNLTLAVAGFYGIGEALKFFSGL